MTVADAPSKLPPPPRFQFGLRTLLLLFVVLGSSLAVFGIGGILVFAATVALAAYLRYARSAWSFTHLVLVLLYVVFLAGWLLITTLAVARDADRRLFCLSHLHDFSIALDEYHRENGTVPPAHLTDNAGKPVHSWRVLILPLLERNDLFTAYDFTEPWNGSKNAKLLPAMPRLYICPSDVDSGMNHTSYVAVVGPNSAWLGATPRKLDDLPDGGASTILLVEVSNSGIAWAEPRDFSVNAAGVPDAGAPALAAEIHHGLNDEFFFTYEFGAGVHVVTADFRVRVLKTAGLSPKELGKKLQIGGCSESDFADDNPAIGRRHVNWRNIAALAVWLLSVAALLTGAARGRRTQEDAQIAPALSLGAACDESDV